MMKSCLEIKKLTSLLVLSFLVPWGRPLAAADASGINFKLFFQQMFVLEIKKEMTGAGADQTAFKNAIMTHTAYTDLTFNQAIDKVLAARTAEEAYRIRSEVFGGESSYMKINSLQLNSSVPYALRARPTIEAFLAAINKYAMRSIAPDENFFTSPEGSNFLSAMAFDPKSPSGQRVAFVMMPGYAAHTIKFEIFPEILADMNMLQGRPAARPIIDDSGGMDIVYETPQKFYANGPKRPLSFDILHPAGWEMGNTVGLNADTADRFAEWLDKLPAPYKDCKLIMLGYSKGAPVLLEFLQRYPRFKSRVLGLVTFAGVLQGTHIARSALSVIDGYLGTRTIGELIDKVRAKGSEESLNALAPFLSPFDLGFLKLPKIKEVMRIYDIDTSKMNVDLDRILNGRELREVRDGAVDLSPYVRTLFNLLYFDNTLVDPGTFVFNLSGITDISTFASRRITDGSKVRQSSLLTPRLNADYKVAFKDFSLDAWFLYLSSQEGFKMAPGGLYDTQVDLQHTKTPWLDTSPLSASLTREELTKLWDNPQVQNKVRSAGINSYQAFCSTPRANLLAPAQLAGLNALDLGEFKGHHWSLFLQAFRPPEDVSKDFAVWQFPRKAFMRALLQTMALYNLTRS